MTNAVYHIHHILFKVQDHTVWALMW